MAGGSLPCQKTLCQRAQLLCVKPVLAEDGQRAGLAQRQGEVVGEVAAVVCPAVLDHGVDAEAAPALVDPHAVLHVELVGDVGAEVADQELGADVALDPDLGVGRPSAASAGPRRSSALPPSVMVMAASKSRRQQLGPW